MLARLLLLFIIVPFIELTLLLWLASVTHWTYTLGLIVVTGVVGTFLARSQGLRVWRTMQEELAAGRMPAQSLADGAMILFAGGLLLTPGILTDLFGLSLLLPPCRTFYRALILSRISVQPMSFGPSPWASGEGDKRPMDEDVVEAEFERHEGGDRIVDSYIVDSSDQDDR